MVRGSQKLACHIARDDPQPDARHPHQTTASFVVPRQGQELAGKTGDLSPHHLAHRQERAKGLLQQQLLANEFRPSAIKFSDGLEHTFGALAHEQMARLKTRRSRH